MDINDTKGLVILQCKRIIEILESKAELNRYEGMVSPELKAKMHELRRDTVRLQNQIYRPYDFKNGDRV